MKTAEPGQAVTLFRVKGAPNDDPEYMELVQEMMGLAQGMPGFVSADMFAGQEGDQLIVVVFERDEDTQRWREHPRHQYAQKLGKERFYPEYSIATCTCLRVTSKSAE